MKLPPHPEGYVCVKSDHAIVLTGKLDDPAWETAPWTKPFLDIEGKSKPKPAWQTRVKMLWDEDYFYIAAELEEPHVWATLTEHDSVIFHDNDFEVFIDPDGDNHQYYEYEINALGTDWDLRLVKPYRDGGPALNEWEVPGLKRAVHVNGTINDPSDTDKSWSVELAFPWKVLAEFSKVASPPLPGDQWRVNFSRVEWDVVVKDGKYVKVPDRPEHNWVWSQQGAVDMHRPEMWGYVQFEEKPAAFRADSDWETKCRLIEIYRSQKRIYELRKRYTTRGEELGQDLADVKIEVRPEGYTARLGSWQIRQDSLLTKSQ